jgi:hypothetical protein
MFTSRSATVPRCPETHPEAVRLRASIGDAILCLWYPRAGKGTQHMQPLVTIRFDSRQDRGRMPIDQQEHSGAGPEGERAH